MPLRAGRPPEGVSVFFKQFYLACLAQASYLIGSEGEAAVVDPRRDVEEYLAEAAAQGLRIRYVVETHLHADFVSGHRELAERTGAEVLISARAGATFPHRAVHDGDEVALGALVLRFLETPGHTPESMCVLVSDGASPAEPALVLTGDTLFIGDVGRPDLAGAQGLRPQDMASLLYDSLHRKLLTLPDTVAVYPAHGAGSLCGRNMSSETSSTIGEQRRTNYALQPMTRERFVEVVTADLPEAPRYFPMDVELNRQGAPALAERPLPPALTPEQVAEAAASGAVVLDVRAAADFGAAHVPGAVNVGLGGQFASWAGTLLEAERPLVVVAEGEERVREAVVRLARVGLERVVGFLEGGVAAWERAGRPLARLPQIAVDELRARLGEDATLQVLDVRRPAEYDGGHVPHAVPVPLDRLQRELERLDAARPTAVICAGGYRSSAAASLLLRHGFAAPVCNVVGGTSAWVAAGYATEG
jgi:glyoxylase-like metal-dependent hydrolase (beta-lactamase superfamily II)/3-mercaptopyruvate sulfurtransferase SseA